MAGWDHVKHPDAYADAIRNNIKMNASKTRREEFFRANPDAQQIVDWLHNNSGTSNFALCMQERWAEWGNLTVNQADAVRRCITQDAERRAKWAERDAKSEHVGTVGERRKFTATLAFFTYFDTAYGTKYVHVFRDDEDNVIVQKGASLGVEKGEKAVFHARIKEHGERNGVKQTIVERVTKLEIITEEPNG